MNAPGLIVELVGGGKKWQFEHGPVRIGRGSACEIDLTGFGFEGVSESHVSLDASGGQILIEDMGSRAGTYVNGKRVERAGISPADTFQVGRGGPSFRVSLLPQGTAVRATAPRAPARMQPQSSPAPTVQSSSGDAHMERRLKMLQQLLTGLVILVAIQTALVLWLTAELRRTVEDTHQMLSGLNRTINPEAIHQSLREFEARIGGIQKSVGGVDQKIKNAENDFIKRLDREMPRLIDNYVAGKVSKLTGQKP